MFAWTTGYRGTVGPITALAILCSGCAMTPSSSIVTGQVEVGCVDDSQKCLRTRKASLEAIMKDKSRKWVKTPANVGDYASGVRMFAFMKLRRRLSCAELTAGLSEAKGARSALRSAKASLTPAQISRGALLGDEVAEHMRRELRRKRCKISA